MYCDIITYVLFHLLNYCTMPNRKFISIVDKSTAINNIKNGKERKIVDEELGVGLSTIVGWMKDEKNIIENSKIVNSKNVIKLNYHLMMM